jgi:hypothetical protein
MAQKILFGIELGILVDFFTFAPRLTAGVLAVTGEMSEWFKEHAWKVCIRQKCIRGSNPRLSASTAIALLGRRRFFLDQRVFYRAIVAQRALINIASMSRHLIGGRKPAFALALRAAGFGG